MLSILNEELQQNENGKTEHLGTVNNPMSFPESTNTLSDHSHAFMKSLAFPASLPHGKEGDVTVCDRASTSTRAE